MSKYNPHHQLLHNFQISSSFLTLSDPGSLVSTSRDYQVGAIMTLYKPHHQLFQHKKYNIQYLHHFSRSVTWGAWSPPLETTK